MNQLATNFIAACAVLLGVVLGIYFYGQHKYHAGQQERVAFYEPAIQKQKAEAAQLLAEKTAEVRAKEDELRTFVTKQENTDAEHKKIVDTLSDRYRRLLAKSGGVLRDPNATGCSVGTPSTEPSAPKDGVGDGAQAGGVLSVPLSDLLWGALRDADIQAAAYASCRPYALKLGAPPPN
jgi:hypothetical protein